MRSTMLAACVVVCAAGTASAVPSAIYSSVVGQSNRSVPGIAGLSFNSFDRPQPSPSGNRWIMLARTDSGNTANDALYMTGLLDVGVVRVREGVTEIEPGRVAENVSDRRAGILDDGRFGLALNLTGATTDDSVGVGGDDMGGLSVRFREGQSVGAIPGVTFGAALSDASIDTSGKISVRATSLGGATSTTNAALLRSDGNTLSARTGTTSPAGQVGTPQLVTSLSFGSYYTSASGASFLYKADLAGPAATNQVLVVNNNVVLQEGTTISGLGSPITNIISQNMSADGSWYARGENANDQPWIVRNGSVIAKSGDPVPGGITGETWSNAVWNVSNGNTFGLHTGNQIGDFIIGGFTSNPDASKQYALVLNNSSVVLREGDAIDLNGDGLLNDDAFFDVTGLNGASLDNKVDNFFLTDDLWLYGVIDLRNGAGADIGEAYVRILVPAPGAAGLLAVGAFAMRRRRATHG